LKQRIARAGVLAVALVLTHFLLAPPAQAAEDSREVQGRKLYAKGDYQGALEIYATLFAERAEPIYLRNIGRCNQKLRRPEQAIDAFNDYLRRGRKITAAEREEIQGYIKEMEELKTRNESRERERTAREAAEARAAREAAEARAAREAAEARTARESGDTARATPPPPPPGPGETAGAGAARGERAQPPSPDVEVVPREMRPAPEASGQTGTFFLALAAGSGFGLASGEGELNPEHRIAASGFATTQLGHLAPELGIFIARRLLLSVQMRLQYVSHVTGQYLTGVCGTNENYCQPEPLGLAAFGRIAWLSGSGPVHFVPGLAVGGGNVRHAMHFKDDRMCGMLRTTSCVDTIASGPFLFGPSVGLLVELGDVVGLMATVNTQIGVPKFTLNFDFNAGLTFRI
jgi:hypothetical protein